jgi:antitoxin ParD1/3/4
MPRTITFQPSPEISEFIEDLVESGTYQNQSEIIREGLRLLQEKKAGSKLQQIKSLIEEGDNSGDMVNWSAQDFITRMKRKSNGENI